MASVSGKHYSSEEDMEREVELRVIQRLQKQETKQFSGSEKQSSNEIVQYESILVFVPNLNYLMQCRFLNNLAN